VDLKSLLRFAGMSAYELGAGTAFEVKCLLAIDAIAAVYRADREPSGTIESDSFLPLGYRLDSELIFSQLNRLLFAGLMLIQTAPSES
jgi:hypothetical protein